MNRRSHPQRTPHELNKDFTWSRHAVAGRVLTKAQLESYDETGYVLISNAVSPSVVEDLRSTMDRLQRAVAPHSARQTSEPEDAYTLTKPGSMSFVDGVALVSEAVQTFVCSPLMAQIAGDILGPEVCLYQDHAVYKLPAGSELTWHQDNGYEYADPQDYLTCWLALSRSDEDTGCVRVEAGGHLDGTLHHWPTEHGRECFSEAPSNAVSMPMEAGDLLLFSAVTPHMSLPNMTDEVRKAYIVHYAQATSRWVEPPQGREPGPVIDAIRNFPIFQESSG